MSGTHIAFQVLISGGNLITGLIDVFQRYRHFWEASLHTALPRDSGNVSRRWERNGDGAGDF